MKKIKDILSIIRDIVIIFSLLSLNQTQVISKETHMIRFPDTAPYITFPPNANYDNLSDITVIMWHKFSGFQASGYPNTLINKEQEWLSPTGWGFEYYGNAADNFLWLGIDFSTTNGIFKVTGLTLDTAQIYQLVFTYNKTSAANRPIFYVNGVAQSTTTTLAPAGTATDDTPHNLHIGGVDSSGYSSYGDMYSVLIYNRILSASDISSSYASGVSGINSWAEQNSSGLVFYPNMNMATGILKSNFTGSTLGTSNTIIDRIGCIVGVPAGNPLGE